jgi:hypothetical protein
MYTPIRTAVPCVIEKDPRKENGNVAKNVPKNVSKIVSK